MRPFESFSDFSCKLTVLDTDTKGVIEGYGAVFTKEDQGGDSINPGAFKASLKTDRKVRMLWDHNPSYPIGRWDSIKEDDYGLFCRGQLNLDTTKGKETHALITEGAIDGLSIGYRTKKATTSEASPGTRILQELELWEVSVVTFPMQPDANILGAKRDRGEIARHIEAALRDAGLSNREAKTVVSHGIDPLLTQRDAGNSNVIPDELEQALIEATAKLKGALK